VILLASKYYSAMRKSYFLLIPLLIWGCEKSYEEIIDSGTDNYQVSTIAGIKDTVDLRKEPGDSLLNLRLIFTPSSQVYKAYFDIYASDNSRLNTQPVEMFEVIDNLYENQFSLKREYPIGNYIIRFYAEGFEGNLKQVALGTFYFKNGQDNLPPVISNVICPDTVSRGINFVFSVKTVDPNGRADILSTFFSLYRPDGTPVEENPGDIYFAMDDSGNLEVFGDSTANDGVYSFKNSFSPTSMTGQWKFVFQAIDRSNSLSNVIEHYLLVQ
jgi:hypothetical protein